MERIAWKLTLKEGKKEEYKRRHDEIWPEMTEVLNEAGIHNYTIWHVDHSLFGYYEVEDREHSNKVLSQSPVVDKWNKYMEDVMYVELDESTGTVKELEMMFYHK
ncbi:MAG: L-rhamnose 1-epimerase [Clostridia bacterium]|jgi:L-rhamnose mutarotase|nr:L-rhamnose 1-epimerase [Clostridia bacterium]